jgi:hypothetical protein
MDNTTTNGQSFQFPDDPVYEQIGPEPEGTIKRKLRTRSYKTELGKMTESRNRWQAIAISSFISIAILITALAYKIFQS